MTRELSIQTVRLSSGETLPVLKRANGLPIWDASLFVLTELRARNLALNTILQALRAIKVGEQVLDYLGIDLRERLIQGVFLALNEIDALSDLLGLTQETLDALSSCRLPVQKKEAAVRVVTQESVRIRRSSNTALDRVSSDTAGIRLMYFRDYLGWQASQTLRRLDPKSHAHQRLARDRAEVVAKLTARMPKPADARSKPAREGLDADVAQRIRSVIHPESPLNPWKSQHVRARNQLVFEFLLSLGLRRGELLCIKVKDVDLRRNEVCIVRRPDDPEDARVVKPQVKTRGRLLKISSALAELTSSYIQRERRSYINARKHPFLFVATGTGKALSLSAITKLFSELRTKVPDLPDELCAHMLRHTWNDRFSELMDEKGISPELEEQLRRQQMGWSDSSAMATVYTRRHIRRKANEVSLELQAKALANKMPETSHG